MEKQSALQRKLKNLKNNEKISRFISKYDIAHSKYIKNNKNHFVMLANRCIFAKEINHHTMSAEQYTIEIPAYMYLRSSLAIIEMSKDYFVF